MEPIAALINNLLNCLPKVHPKFRSTNENTLLRWKAGEAVPLDVAALLAAWAQYSSRQFNESELQAFVAGVVCQLGEHPDQPTAARELIIALSYVANLAPWQDTEFVASVLAVLPTVTVPREHRSYKRISSALKHLVANPAASVAKAHVESVLEQLDHAKSEVSPARSDAPRQIRQLPADDAICGAMRDLCKEYLPRDRLQSNLSIIDAAAANAADRRARDGLLFLAGMLLSQVGRMVGGDVFRLAQNTKNWPLMCTVATFLQNEPPHPSSRGQEAANIAFWITSLQDMQSQRALPTSVAKALKAESVAQVLGGRVRARQTFLRFSYQWLAQRQARGRLDVNSVREWLEAIRSVALTDDDRLDPSVSDLLPPVLKIAERFECDAAVGYTLASFRTARHPWTSDAILPCFTSDECTSLDTDLKALRLSKVRTFLTSQSTLQRLREHLEKSLAAETHDRFRPPTGGWRPRSLDEARLEMQRASTEPTRIRRTREWYAYLLTEQNDILRAKDIWESSPSDSRGHSERWNLAVVSTRIGDNAKAFRELWEGAVASGNAPYEHARFAAWLGLSIGNDVELLQRCLRLLPIPAVHAYAYALKPPTDPTQEAHALGLIVRLAEDRPDLRSKLPRNRDQLREKLDSVRTSLNSLGFTTTWRMWLLSCLESDVRSAHIRDALYEAWSIDNARIAEQILLEGVEVFGGPRDVPEGRVLSKFVRRFLAVSQKEPRKLRCLNHAIRRAGQNYLREYEPELFDELWPSTILPPLPTPSDVWQAIDRRLNRNTDFQVLFDLVAQGLDSLAREAPDIRTSTHAWLAGFRHFLQCLSSIRGNDADPAVVSKANAWLAANPPDAFSGLLARLRPVAEWCTGLFTELVRASPGVAPLPTLQLYGPTATTIPKGEGLASVLVDVIASDDRVLESVTLRSSCAGQRPGRKSECRLLRPSHPITVAVPIVTSPEVQIHESVHVEVHATYNWGVVRGLETSAGFDVAFYDYSEILAEKGIRQDSLPTDIFVYDRPLTMTELTTSFTGRTEDIEYVATRLRDRGAELPGTPIYFHGIRKVGKTSLLRRLECDDVISRDDFFPLYVSLFGLGNESSLVAVVDTVFREVRRELCARTGSYDASLTESPAPSGTDEDALRSYAQLPSYIAKYSNGRTPLVFFDEFHNIVWPRLSRLLDLLRQQYERRELVAILSGWVDHNVLQQRCPETHLLPLDQRSISFLVAQDVTVLLSRRLATIGVDHGKGLLEHVMRLTDGHPNLCQRVCGLALHQLNRERRFVLTTGDLDVAGQTIIDDGAQFTHSCLHPSIVTLSERQASRQVVAALPKCGGGWLPVNKLDREVRKHVLELIHKQVLVHDATRGEVRVRGTLLEQYLRRTDEITSEAADPARRNVVMAVDYENVCMFTGDDPQRLAQALRWHATRLGHVRTCVVAAHWTIRRDGVRARNAFSTEQFAILNSLRTRDRRDNRVDKDSDADLADNVIVRDLYSRLHEERDSANDRIDTYVIVSGDGRFLEHIKYIVEQWGKCVHLVGKRDHPHMADDYREYERIRTQVAAMPGRNPTPDFCIDDIGELLDEYALDRATASAD